MILGVCDFETTSPDPKVCMPLEFALQTYDSTTGERGKPFSRLIWGTGYSAVPEEITELTGITTEEAKTGVSHAAFLNALRPHLQNVDVLVAYNAEFDRTVLNRLYRSFDQRLPSQEWFCAMQDLPWPTRLERCRKLQHRALDLGISMDERDSHRAMADVTLLGDIFDLWDMEEVLKYWRIPSIVISAKVPGPWIDGGKGRDEAKTLGFGWECVPGTDSPKFEKKWVKKVKKDFTDLSLFPFPVEVVG